jgi:hypothetical protein
VLDAYCQAGEITADQTLSLMNLGLIYLEPVKVSEQSSDSPLHLSFLIQESKRDTISYAASLSELQCRQAQEADPCSV